MSKQRTDDQKFTCIMCPLGCEVTVRLDEHGEIKETVGAKCPKGERYAAEELKHPKRVLTTTVAIDGAAHARLPVRSSSLIPKDRIIECIHEAEKVRARAPVRIGDVIIRNILGTSCNMIASRDLS